MNQFNDLEVVLNNVVDDFFFVLSDDKISMQSISNYNSNN